MNGFVHSAFNEAVKHWDRSLYPFPLAMYDFKPLTEPQAILSIDFRQPLFSVEIPSELGVKEEGSANCLVIWCEYYLGEVDSFEDVPENWLTPYENGKFVFYKKQLVKFKKNPTSVKEGETVKVTATLDNTLKFSVEF